MKSEGKKERYSFLLGIYTVFSCHPFWTKRLNRQKEQRKNEYKNLVSSLGLERGERKSREIRKKNKKKC